MLCFSPLLYLNALIHLVLTVDSFYEFRNAVLQHVRHASLPIADAMRMIQDAKTRFENRVDKAVAADVMTLALTTQCSAYDCEYVALAQKLQVPLLTYDKRVLREFPKVAIKPRDYLNNL